MHKKTSLWGYFSISLLLFALVPNYFPTITMHQYATMFFGYQEKPFYLALVSIFNLFFDYVSLIIPIMELRNIQYFVFIRKPIYKQRMQSKLSIAFPYFVPFFLIKLTALYFEQSIYVLFWSILSGSIWFVLLFSITNHFVKPSIIIGLTMSTLVFIRFISMISV